MTDPAQKALLAEAADLYLCLRRTPADKSLLEKRDAFLARGEAERTAYSQISDAWAVTGGRTRRNPIVPLLVAGLLAAPGSLNAQISCSGVGCDQIPITPAEYNQILTEIQLQYTDDLFEKTAEAMVLANLSAAPVGTVNLQSFTIGAQGLGGFVDEEQIDIIVPQVGVLEDVTNVGAAVNARLFAGVNLGWLTGNPYDPYKDGAAPSMLSLSRFDVYVGGLKYEDTLNDELGLEDGELVAKTKSEMFELRYHLVEGSNIAAGPLLRFRGVSLGGGYSATNQTVEYAASTNSFDVALAEGIDLEWAGQDRLFYENDIKTYNLEVRSGFQVLYLFNFVFGGGYAVSDGEVDFILTRSGPVIARSQNSFSIPEEFLESVPPELLNSDLLGALSTGEVEAGVLGLTVAQTKEVPRHVWYFRGGVELNLWALKLALEGVTTGRAYGANAGVRLEF